MADHPAAVRLTGRLICRTAAEVATVRQHLPDHIRLTRAEPGCLSFSVEPVGDPTGAPMVWNIEETFIDRAAFDAHTTRARRSKWGFATNGIPRDYTVTGP